MFRSLNNIINNHLYSRHLFKDLAVTIKHPRHRKNRSHSKQRDDAHQLPDKTPLLSGDGSPRGSLSYGSTNPIKHGDTSFSGSGDVPDDVAIKV